MLFETSSETLFARFAKNGGDFSDSPFPDFFTSQPQAATRRVSHFETQTVWQLDQATKGCHPVAF